MAHMSHRHACGINLLREPGARDCDFTFVLFKNSYLREGLVCQIIIYVIFKGDLTFLPFKSRMTVHSNSLASPVLMPLSRLPWPDLHPGTRAQSRVVRRDPKWQSLAWRLGLLSPHAPSTPTVNPRDPMLQRRPSSQMSCYPPNTIKTPPKLYFISTHLSLLEGAERSFFFFFSQIPFGKHS